MACFSPTEPVFDEVFTGFSTLISFVFESETAKESASPFLIDEKETAETVLIGVASVFP